MEGECNAMLGEGELREALDWRGARQEELFAMARRARDEAFPAREVEVRSVIEISNICQQGCYYCSISKGTKIKRYALERSEVVEIARKLYEAGRRVLLLQSGENESFKFAEYIGGLTRAIHEACPEFEIILCCGNFPRDVYGELRAAGATRYILKFEASNPELYHRIKPTDTFERREECLGDLLAAGFQVGSGNIVGLPGQTKDDLVSDLLYLGRFPLAMSSTTVFIPNEASGYRDEPAGDLETTLNFMALIRLRHPERLIPTTSALGRLGENGMYRGLMAGANTVTVHDGTPEQMKSSFPIYSTHRFTPGSMRLLEATAEAGLTPAEKGMIHAQYRH